LKEETLPRRVAELRTAHPDATLEVWAEDEHRVGLRPILRRVWARRGTHPRALVRPRYEWLYLVAFVCPESGKSSFWLLPTISAALFQLVLEAFAQEQGVGPNKRILLVLDQAGWHVAREIMPPEGLGLIFLPPYSPELMPVERIWTLADEDLVNRTFKSLDELSEVLGRRCASLDAAPEKLSACTLYHWWPRVAAA